MSTILFLGDDLSAAGWRLAGVRTLVARAGEESIQFSQALAQAELLLVTAGLAAKLPKSLLDRALVSTLPMVVIIPDVRGRRAVPDLVGRMQAQLGLSP